MGRLLDSMKWLIGRYGLWIAVLWFAQSARATQFVPLPIETLVEQSQLILQGTVLSKTTLRDETGQIYTKIEIDVSDVWKGTIASNRFTIVQGGGTLGDRRVMVTGQAEFKIGEEIVAFLVINKQGEGVILGLSQGKFQVWRDQSTGEKLTRNMFHGGAPPNAPVQIQRAKAAGASLTVTSLKQRVRQAAK
jgi:hypothetical protein